MRQWVQGLAFWRHDAAGCQCISVEPGGTVKCHLWGNQPFIPHVQSNPRRSLWCAFAISGLQHVELSLLHGELDVLHVG